MAEEPAESTLETTWQSAGGLSHKVTTTRQVGEGADGFAGRHKEEVDALKTLYPPVE